MTIAGRWRIVGLALWDREAIDLLGPGFIEIGSGHEGSVRFIAVEGWMDIRAIDREATPGIEYE